MVYVNKIVKNTDKPQKGTTKEKPKGKPKKAEK